MIFSTKYRKNTLVLLSIPIKKILLEIKGNFNIKTIGCDRNHVHMLISSTPMISCTQIARRLKQMSTHKIYQNSLYKSYLNKLYWNKQVFWL